jgi:phenylpropionate dioxygenase-like ring-hydroxylating dioxygenase large terminal subunit
MMNKKLRDQYWHLLCHRSELPQPGDFLRLQWLGQDVVAANDAGEIIVFDNLCPHRGARFFDAEYGNAPISCTYHGWTFQAGTLLIPAREKYKACELSKVSMGMLKTEWCGDFLFASLKPAQTLDMQLGDLSQQLASISMDINGRADWNAYTYECDWKIAIENGLDSLHTPYVHTETLGRLSLSDPENAYVADNSTASFQITDTSVAKKLKSAARLFSRTEPIEGYISIYLFPFTMLTSTCGLSYSLQNFFPSAQEQKTHFYSRLLKTSLRTGVPAASMDHFFLSTAEVNRQVFREDHHICSRIPIQSYNWNDVSRLSVDEEKIIHFRKSLQRVASAGEC